LHWYFSLRSVWYIVNHADTELAEPKTILIVEDNELNMKLWSDVLEAQGYELFKTAFAIEALGIAHERRPDLILLDIQLPDISGFELARTLKADEVSLARGSSWRPKRRNLNLAAQKKGR
jgi:CheY-like chemotaxis protein